MFRLHIIFGIAILFSLQVWGEGPFQWVDDENYKPLTYQNNAGKSKGVFHDVLTEVFRRMNIPLENKLYPWSRAQKMVKEGEADGMVTVYSKARQKYFKATDPIVIVQEHIFTNRSNPKINDILNIRSVPELRKFVLVDTIDAGWSRENLKEMHVIWVPTSESAINMVATQRADIYLMSNFSGPYFLAEQIKKNGPLHKQLKEIVIGMYPIATIKYQLLIRKDSAYVDIIDEFNKVLQQIHTDGTYEKILQQYKIDMSYRPKGHSVFHMSHQ